VPTPDAPTRPRRPGCRGRLGAVAVRKAATAIAAGHRALAVVPPGLRHPALYVPLNSGNAAVRAVGRQVLPLAGTAIRPGVRAARWTVPTPAAGSRVRVLA